ncbi:addiction module protein [Rubripirellula sp.]|nr:addiction module protein [Rubripirellula sp.]MDF1845229.1 addiction module protein [Rubripirellula sp.]
MATGDDFQSQIFALPAIERADLARQLLLSLENDSFDDDVQRAWAEEAERRSVAHQQGETDSRDWQESVNEMRESLKERRQK